ncbi:MAG: hypothetical protein QNL62_17125 [Gammaproteobacteria bacterium]|nr:hypothetical protein [Gammaproteobacteria bacterium]
MEALIPKLFIITAEASIVLFLLLIIMIIFNSKAKRKDIKTVNELVSKYVSSKVERIAALKKQLQGIAFTGNMDEQAEQLYNQEKSLIKEFVTLYLRRDSYRLLDYPENVMDVDNSFLATSGSGSDTTAAPPVSSTEDSSEESANATILAREQAESKEVHLKELTELRLKNTELNEQLFEALETITALMTEHGKKTGQEVETNAQKVLQAIIYLRDQRLGKDTDPSDLAPPANDGHDQVQDPWSVDLADNDATLDEAAPVNLGIRDELNTDLDTLDEEEEEENLMQDAKTEPPENPAQQAEPAAINLEQAADQADPWADALAEQAKDQTEPSQAPETTTPESTTPETTAPETTAEEVDPWADALAEQAQAEASSDEEEDPWAAALAEQEKSENK